MRILLINNFVPPDESPTARLLSELATGLAEKGWIVDFVGAAQGYRKRKKLHGWRRWLKELAAHAKIFVAGLRNSKPDYILCLSDPPGLVFTVSMVARLRGVRLAHWAMDVYPEIALALTEIREGWLPRCVAATMRYGYRRCSVLAALDKDMPQVLYDAAGVRSGTVPPWPPMIPSSNQGRSTIVARESVTWLYSGNLGRAHDFSTVLHAQKVLETKGLPVDLIFQGGGPSWTAAKVLADSLDLRRCYWLDYVESESLLESLSSVPVLIATQREETKGLLWPSKLALISLLPRSIVWVGPQDGAIAKAINNRATPSITVACGDSDGLASWMETHYPSFQLQKLVPIDVSLIRKLSDEQYRDAIAWWHAALSKV